LSFRLSSLAKGFNLANWGWVSPSGRLPHAGRFVIKVAGVMGISVWMVRRFFLLLHRN
jgi:hypothetical protein